MNCPWYHSIRVMVWMGAACLVIALASKHLNADPVPWSLPTLLERIPPLTHDATGRLPMITWTPFVMGPDDDSFKKGRPLPAAMYQELVRRGLTQRVPLGRSYVPMAVAIQNAGASVIIMDVQDNDHPYNLIDGYLHEIAPDSDIQLRPHDRLYPCPMIPDGWKAVAKRIHDTLSTFKQAGVNVRAVWLDWETEPKGGTARWRQAKNCLRCRMTLPADILNNERAYDLTMGMLHWDRYRHFVARPILTVYPTCVTTNWLVVVSSYDLPTKAHWGHRNVRTPRDLGGFTASNPVAYAGEPVYRHLWQKEWGWPLDSEHMDRVYTHAMLSGLSQDTANKQRLGSDAPTIPWVARYCPEAPREQIPRLSRRRYREILRHLWLRGADSIQIFNHLSKDNPTLATEEVEDAVAVYDEMLAYRAFLDKGSVMNTAVPSIHEDGVIWSGLSLGAEAIVRGFTPTQEPSTFTTCPWGGGPAVTLRATPEGRTYRLRRDGDDVHVTEQ